MLQQESIYNLIPPKKIIPNRSANHISIYPPDIPPTSSTFVLNGSSFPGISNCNGDYKLPRGGHPTLRNSATFGLPLGAYAPDPKNYHKKGETYKILPPLEKLHQICKIKKPPVPSVNDRPIQGLKSEKNFTPKIFPLIKIIPKPGISLDLKLLLIISSAISFNIVVIIF